jgi:hypothetical protein
MSALKTISDDPALHGQRIAHEQARALLGQVMGFVAVTAGFAALGAHLGADLSGATGQVLFIGAFACILYAPTSTRVTKRALWTRPSRRPGSVLRVSADVPPRRLRALGGSVGARLPIGARPRSLDLSR